MNTFTKGNDTFPSRDWSMLPTALSTIESIIHPQNSLIFNLLLDNDEVAYNELLQKTGLNPRQLKRRMGKLLTHNLVHEFHGITNLTYCLAEDYYNLICKKSKQIVQSTLSVI